MVVVEAVKEAAGTEAAVEALEEEIQIKMSQDGQLPVMLTFQIPSRKCALIIILTGEVHFIVLTPCPVSGPTFHHTHVQSRSPNDKLANSMLK